MDNKRLRIAVWLGVILHILALVPLAPVAQAQTILTETIAAELPEELRIPTQVAELALAQSNANNTGNNSESTNVEPSPLAPPPVVTSIDEAGVNVISGMPVVQQSDLQIGTGFSRLNHTMATYNGKFWGLYDDFTISIQRGPTPAYTTVTIGHQSQIFAHSSGSSGQIIYSPLNEDGATLTRDSNNKYTYTRADGMVYQQANQRIIYPNGFAITIHYGNEQPYTDVFGQTQYRKRRQAVTTNTGLMFKYHYRTEGYPNYPCEFPFTGKNCNDAHSEFYYPDKITAINTAVEYCNPTANDCSLSHHWPEVQYQWPAAEDMFARHEYGAATARAVFSITDAEGVISDYTHQRFGIKKPSGEPVLSVHRDWEHVTRLTSIKAGTSASQATATLDYEDFVQSFPAEALNVIIQKVRNMLVTEVTINGATYDYNHKQPDTPYRKTGTSIGPRGNHSSVMALHGVLDVKVSTTTPRYHTTYNEHQQHNRIETSRDYGQTVSYQQDNRGNITERTQQAIANIANDNSPDITENAHYPETCSNLKTCNQPEWVEDGEGNRTHYTYHAQSGQVASITYPANRSGIRAQRRFYYEQHYAQVKNASGDLVNADSAVWLLSKERYCRNSAANGDTCAVNNDEVIINYSYSPLNLWLTSKVVSADGKQQRTCYQYNALGNRIGVVLPKAGVNDCGNGLFTHDTVQASGDFVSASRFNLTGQLTGTIAPDPDNQLLNLSGNANENNSESAGESNGPLKFLATRHTYNAQGMKVITELGELSQWQDNTIAPADWGANFTIHTATHYTYDNYGRKLSERVRLGSNIHRLTEFSYDSLGQLQCQTVRMNPDTFTTNRNACTLSDPTDRITRFTYDSDGFVVKEQRALLTPLAQDYATYEYDQHKNRTSVTDANGNFAKLEYDGHKRLKTWYFPTKTSVGAGTHNSADYEQYQYDNNHNRTQLRKRDGRIINYQYNALNQLIKKDWPGTTTHDVYYGYNLQGLPLYTRYAGHASNNNGVTQQFDGFGNLSQSQLRMPVFGASENESGNESESASQIRTLTFNYDSNNNRTRIQFPDGEAFLYHYDGLNRLYQIQQPGQNALLRQQFHPNGTLHQQQRFTATQSHPFASTALSYDGALRPAVLSHTFPSVVTGQNSTTDNPNNIQFDYTYNPANQLTKRDTSNHQYHYSGNHNATGTYVRNGLNQYTSVNGISMSHDNNGNLQNDGEYQFNFDVENRLINATHHNTGEVTALTYDPLGRLFSVSKAASDSSLLAYTEFLYNGNQLLAEYNQNNQLLRRYLHNSAGESASSDQPLIWFEGSSTEPEKVRHLFTNHNASVIAVANHNGSAIHINNYDAYGIAQNLMGRFAYTGQIQLPEIQLTRPGANGSDSNQSTPLYHYKARSYHPTLGRFLQTDPVGYEDQMNLYAYVGNDPVNRVDPSGETTMVAGAGIGCAVAGPACPLGAAVGAVVATGFTVWFIQETYSDIAQLSENTKDRSADDPLPKDKHGNPIPESEHPHTQIGTKKGRKGKYRQGREFGKNGEHVKDIDFTDHGRSDHPNPHEHPMEENTTGGTKKRGDARPLNNTCVSGIACNK